jgi:tetratricopeptide (TPR) repeat protein
MDDGSAPPEPVRIERVCEGRSTFEAWTDTKGGFGFKVDAEGENSESDASQPEAPPADLNKAINASSSQYSHPITTLLRNCEIQAVLSNFRSDHVKLSIKSTMDNGRLGTIVLHPISRASTLTVSATTLEAPSGARKAYEKAMVAVREQKFDAAAGELAKAVKIYPRFAVAWYEIGHLRQSQNDFAGAAQAWKEGLQADPKYVKPYEGLTALADRQGDWAESEKYSRLWIQLDAEDFPAAYLFNAVANAHLNHVAEAERSAREGLRVDKQQKVPRLHYVLGLILMNQKAYTESLQCFRTYLELAPNAGDANIVRAQLPKIEEEAAQARR